MKRFRRTATAVAAGLLFSLLGSLTGCGGAASTAQGMVTVEGIPVGSGSVKFVPEGDPKGQAAAGAIKDGKYEVTADRGLTAGKYKVEIAWQKPAPAGKATAPVKKADPDMTGPDGPANTAENPVRTATMPAEVKAGSNTIDFAIPK
ncbi:hypothetical protein [Limnoglobus roseus]|uniref:Carboxypeptidase regulatory-like domain-containing protein n=1 Tax=Limnoglobus roseus TaxID=2598579 RepID=A0A5C1ARP2_9BACT|nr:hypothetical protein [Limnoglobus roseus]QEL20827.1 carboxypeptidase regulatory-like domain-containing protein [Limnoglobus roseus]